MVKLISRQELLQSTSDDDDEYKRIGETDLANRFCLLKVLRAVLCGTYMRSAEMELFPAYHHTIKSEGSGDGDATNDDEVVVVEKEDNESSGGPDSTNCEDDAGNTMAKDDVEETKATHKNSKKSSTNAERALKQLQVYTGYDNTSMGTMLSGKRHRKGAAAANNKCPDDEVTIIRSSLSAAKKKVAAAEKQKKTSAAKLPAVTNKKIKVEKDIHIKNEETPIKLLRSVAKQSETKSRPSLASIVAQKKDDAALLEADAMYAKNIDLLQKIEAATAKSVQAALAISNSNAERLHKNSGIFPISFIDRRVYT